MLIEARTLPVGHVNRGKNFAVMSVSRRVNRGKNFTVQSC